MSRQRIAKKERGRLCHYRPCPPTTVRKVTFKTEQILLNHQQKYHPEALAALAKYIADKATRRRFHGGARAITAGALRDFGMDDPLVQQSGQMEMDRCTRINEEQFEEPQPSYDYLPATNASHQLENLGNQIDGLDNDDASNLGKEEYVVHSRVEHPTAGQTMSPIRDSDKLFPKRCNPFHPFDNPYDFKLGSFLLRGNTTNKNLGYGFNGGIYQRQVGRYRTSITSSYTLDRKLDNLHPEFGKSSWFFGEASFWANEKRKRQPYYFRDPTLLIKHFVKQPAYRHFLAYKPVREYNEKGSRIYSELYSGDWMWDQQDKIPIGGTVIPTLVTSDQTRLSSHVGGHMFWPLYMSIGNLHSTVRNRPSNNGWILLAQLPVPPAMKKHIIDKETGNAKLDKDGLSKSEYDRLYKAYKDDAFGAVIRDIFEPLRMAAENGMELECADGFVRTGYPVLAAWLADFQEYNKIYTTPPTACCVCEVSHSQLGDNYIASRRDSDEHTKALQLHNHLKARIRLLKWVQQEIKEHGIQFLRQYNRDRPDLKLPSKGTEIAAELRTLNSQFKMASLYFTVRQSQSIDNALWKTGIANVQDVWKPDMLHTIYEGMVMHILEALEPFLMRHKRLARFEEAWMRIPAFNNIPAPRRSIFETEQRTGKALRDTLRQLLPVLVIALDEPTAEQHFEFYDCLAACRYLVDFSLICQYRYHTDTSLRYLQLYLDGFHRHKNVFNDSRPAPHAEKQQQRIDLNLQSEEFIYNEDEENIREEENAARAAHRIQQAAKTKAESLSKLQEIAKQLFTHDKAQLQTWLDISDNAEVFDFRDVVSKLEEIATKRETRFLDHGAYWKIPKLHLLSHFGETISRFGYLQQYSSEVGETLHKGIKEAYRICNKKEQTKQILQFHTRKFAVRMREMNLEALARDGLYEEEIQEALSLYGERSDRLLAAKLNRDGFGSIQNTDSYAKALAEQILINGEEDQVPTDEPWFMPSPLPLFPGVTTPTTGRRLVGNTTRADTCTVEKLAETFDLPHLATALRHYMVVELDFPSSVLTSDLADLPTATWNTLLITTETVQLVEPLEVQKCVCSGPFRGPRLETPRNDAVVFSDPDEYSSLAVAQSMGSDFGDNRVAILKCLFQVKLPRVEEWTNFLAAGICNFDHTRLKHHSLALVLGLQPMRYDRAGEMIPGALIGKCIMPKIVDGLNHSRQDNLNATHNIQKRNGGRILDLSSISRSVHIIQQHGTKETRDDKKIWAVNNRSDLGIWDMMYAKTAEMEENPDAAPEADKEMEIEN